MFAVPGWNLSADSLATPASSRSHPESEDAVRHASPNSKKRKRDQPEQRISAQELDRLWNRHFGALSGRAKVAGADKELNSANERATKKSKHVLPTEPHSKDAAAVSLSATVEKRKDDSKKKKKAKQKPHSQDSGRLEDHHTESSRTPSATLSNNLGQKSVEPARNSHFSRPAAHAPNVHPQTRAISPPQPPPPPPASTKLTPLQAKMRSRLTSARFRHLNQTLYTSSSSDALQLFSSSPDLFGEYHAGFAQQVKDSWPQNPVDVYIREIKDRGKLHEPITAGKGAATLPLPRRKTGRCTIADLGCGDAPLARGCQSQAKALQLKFHNYDLHAPNSFVTTADIANLPLRDGEVDMVIFCLSLMGTNWIDFVEEAWRVLRGDGKGEVWVAEVKSRFGRVKPKVVENSVGKQKKVKKPKRDKAPAGDEDGPVNGEELFAEDDQVPDHGADATDISAFLDVFQRRGFSLRAGSVDRSNKMFISAVFTKAGIPTAGKYKGWKWTGRDYETNSTRHSGRMKFIDQPEDEVLPEDEARVLKPCVYKAR